MSNDTEQLLDRKITDGVHRQTYVFLEMTMLLSSLFDEDTVAVTVSCGVNNSYGGNETTTSIRICGKYLINKQYRLLLT